jgi:cell cycle sensor histidine kinase DivJ
LSVCQHSGLLKEAVLLPSGFALHLVSHSTGRAVLDRLLHRSVRGDPLAALRHRAFLLSRGIAFCVGLAMLPFFLFAFGAPGLIDELLIAGLLVLPAAIFIVWRNGDLEQAQLISTFGMMAMIGCLAWQTDGLNSFLIGWMIVSLVEAALSGSSRVFTFSLIAFGAVSLILAIAAYSNFLPEPQPPAFTVLALLAAAISLAGNAFALGFGLTTARSEADDKHKLNASRYELIVEHAADMISLHSRNGNLLFASHAAKTILGEEQTRLFDRVHVQDRPAFLNMFERAAQLNKSIVLEFRVQQNDGDFIWVEMNCAPMSKGEGTPLQFAAVTRRIHVRDGESFGEAEKTAEKARIDKNQMLAHLSHELRTPLNAMLGFTEILAGKAGLPLTTRKKNHYATLIHLAGKQMLEVIDRALDVSEAGAGAYVLNPERFQPMSVLDQCMLLMQKQAAKAGVTLKKSSLCAIPEIFADHRACAQILMNLISNAIKFTPSGGSVTLGLSANEDNISFIVSDTGIGIDKAHIEKLGEPFVRLDTDLPGKGLGLSLVKNFARMHGGVMNITSTVGRGTTVSVVLPRCLKLKAVQAEQTEEMPLEREALLLKAVG